MTGSVVAPQILFKHPNEVLSYAMDFRLLLDDGEFLTDIQLVTADSDDLTLGTPVLGIIGDGDENNSVVVQVSDGEDDANYKLTFQVLTSTGQVRSPVGVLIVQS